jgi:signal transduction histidine kinase
VKRPASLAWRLTAPLALAVLLAMGAVALFMDHQVDSELNARFRDALLAQARALTSVVEFEEGRLGARSKGAQAALVGGDAPYSYELRCEGRAATRSDSPPPAPPGWPGEATTTPRFDELDDAGGTQTVMFRFDAPYRGTRAYAPAPAARACRLLVSRPRHDMDQLLLAMDWILALGPVAASLAMLLVVPWLVRRGLAPLRSLAERMRGIGPQAPASRLPDAGVVELEPLVARFNGVLARMDEVLARERQFASGLAHETRTRLAELRSLVDVETRFPSERSPVEVMAEVGAIGAELEATVTALLELTRLEAGFEPARREPVDMGAWLARTLALHQPTIVRRKLELAVEGFEPGDTMITDPALLDMLMGNLIANAVSHAPEDSRVCVSRHGETMHVANDAPELSQADIAQLGHRFWRKRTGEPGHAGLGVSLANAAARALGRTLVFELDDGPRLHAYVR